MPVLARILESEGLATILVTNMPFWAEKIGVPRTLAIEHPFGHTLGLPNNVDHQMRVIRQALSIMSSVDKPGEIVHSEEKWPIEKEEALKDWQPLVPSPVISHMAVNFRQVLRESRKNTKD